MARTPRVLLVALATALFVLAAPLSVAARPASTTPAPTAGTPAPLASWAMVTVPLSTKALVHDATRDVLLATVPSSHASLGNSLVELDPETGELGRHVLVGSEPGPLVVTDDGTRAFVGLGGESGMAEVDLATFTVVRTIPLGHDPTYGPLVVQDLAAIPGRSDLVVAAVRRAGGGSYVGRVFAYQDGVKLPDGLTSTFVPNHIEALGADRLFGFDSTSTGFRHFAITLDDDGLTATSGSGGPVTGFNVQIEAAAGRIYTTTGLIVDPDTNAAVGSFPGGLTEVTPDGVLTTVDVATDVVARFDAVTGQPLESRTVPPIAGGSTLVASASGFAVGGAGAVVLLGPSVSGPAFVAPPAPDATMQLLDVVNVSLQPNDVLFDEARNQLYVTVASASASEADHLLALDPTTGAVLRRLWLGSDPRTMAMAEDGSLLHVGLATTGRVVSVDLASFTSTGSFSLGFDSSMLFAEDIVVRPGTNDELLVSLARSGVSPRHGGVALFVDGIRRPLSSPVHTGANRIVAQDAANLFGYNTETSGDEFFHLAVTDDGVQVLSKVRSMVEHSRGEALLHDGLLYGDGARVLDPVGPEMAATLPAPGPLVIDDANGRIYIMEPSTDDLVEVGLDTHRVVARRTDLSLPGTTVEVVATGTGPDLRLAITSTTALMLLVPPPPPPPEPPPGRFHPVQPSRLADTRFGTGAPLGRVPAGGAIVVDVTGRGGVPVAGVDAVVVNLTSVGSTTASYLTAWATGLPKPGTSNLNFRAGQVAANQAVVPVGDDGTISIANSAGATHVVVDVQGWFGDGTEDGGSTFHALSPARLGDSRTGVGLPLGRVVGGRAVDLDVAGILGVPEDGASAVVVNVTAVGATSPTHLTLWASGETRPTTSNLNVAAGQVVANQAIVPIGADGRIRIANNAGATHVIIDVQGWFGDDGSTLRTVTPTRIADSRTGVGVPNGKVPAGGTVVVDVTGVAGVPDEDVVAVVVNLTVTGATAASHLTAWPTGQAKPGTSNVNFAADQVVANQAIVPVGADGTITIANAFGAAHVVVDVQGWFGAP